MSNSLADLLAKNPSLQLTEGNKIKCTLTNHEMPPNADAVIQYLNGKKFKKATEWYNFDFSEFLPHIVPDKKNPLKLFCKLTKLSLNKIPDEVRKHINGKKFQRLKSEFEAKQKKKQKEQADDDDSSAEIWVPPSDVLEAGDDEDDEEEDGDVEDSGKRRPIGDKAKVGTGVKGKMVGGKVIEEDTMSDLIGSDHDDDDFMDQDGDDDGDEGHTWDDAEDAFDFDALMDTQDDNEEEEDSGKGRKGAAKKGDKKNSATSSNQQKNNKNNGKANGPNNKRKAQEAVQNNKKKAVQGNAQAKKAKK